MADRRSDRTTVGVETVNTLPNSSLARGNLYVARQVNAPDNEPAIFLVNFTYNFGSKTSVPSRNDARLQVAPERCQSVNPRWPPPHD